MRKSVKITQRIVDAAKPQDREITLWDTALPAFGLRVQPSGSASFIVMYRTGGGGRRATLRKYTLGSATVLRAEDARDAAETALAEVKLGGDPAGARSKKKREMTVAELCDLYLAEGTGRKKESTLKTDRGRIDRHIKPLLGSSRITEVYHEDVERFLTDIAEGKTKADIKTRKRGRARVRGGQGTATRTVGLLGGIFSFAVRRRFLKDNPVRGVERFKDKKGERFLSPRELARLGKAIHEKEGEGANQAAIAIIRLLVLTGARKSEIVGLRWGEVDLERDCLRLGDSKTGAKVVLLGPPAKQVLSKLRAGGKADWVFRAEAGGSHFQGVEKVWKKIRAAAKLNDVRIHDLRHSFASAALASGGALPIIGALLGHSDAKTTERYAHLADDPVRASANRTSKRIAAAMKGSNARVFRLPRAGGRTAR